MELRSNEVILRNTRANHLRSYGGVGGRLFLTNQRLIFKPHLFNIRTEENSIPLENIAAIRTPHSDMLSSKLAITLTNNLLEFYVVRKRKDWLKEIENTVTAVKKARGDNWRNDREITQEIVHASRMAFRQIITGAIIIGLITFLGVLFFL